MGKKWRAIDNRGESEEIVIKHEKWEVEKAGYIVNPESKVSKSNCYFTLSL